MSNTQRLKNEALEIISRLFSDMDADETEQANALEEIESFCSDNALVLREQVKLRCE